MELWLGIEDYLQEHATQYRSRVVVFTGPIFSALDPVYGGVDIPLRYFKVAAFINEGELAATGSPFRTFQAPIRDIAVLTGLDLDQLIEDRMPIAATIGAAPVGSTWREIHSPEDLDLDFDLGE
jgi:DNA/RNA endonuclease G (NUC1)